MSAHILTKNFIDCFKIDVSSGTLNPPYRPMVRTSGCSPEDPGSIPGAENFFHVSLFLKKNTRVDVSKRARTRSKLESPLSNRCAIEQISDILDSGKVFDLLASQELTTNEGPYSGSTVFEVTRIVKIALVICPITVFTVIRLTTLFHF